MNYKIFTDSSADLTKDIIEKYDLGTISLSYTNGTENFTYSPKDEDTVKAFYAMLRKKDNLFTSCVNTESFINAFRPTLKSGLDLLYVGFSSGLSATFNSAVEAARELRKEFPERKILCTDTLLASLGQGLMVHDICLLKESGASIEEAYNYCENSRMNVNSIFTVKTLANLARGGRISKLSYAIGTVVDIKPLMYVSKDGKLLAYGKVIGRKRSIFAIAEKVASTIKNPETQTIFISHGDCIEDAELLAKLISQKITVKGFVYNYVDPIIAVHSGPDTLAVFYRGLTREETPLAQSRSAVLAKNPL